ncbi:MAG: hypothetical protein KJ838_05530, partial [Candidatus Omnitrophica bacterium]|nr:hypothetical protein [Candidatus Omnitrophota bacterium]
MSHKGKIGIIILVILLVSSFSAAVIGFYFFQTEKIKVISISEELDNLRVQKRVAEEQLSRARIEIDELSAKYRTVQESIEELSVELEIAGAERGELESEIGILQSELQRQEDLKEQLKARHIQAEEEIIDLKILIHELQANEAGVEGGLKKTEATKEVALGKIVVESKGQEDQSAAAAVENLQTEAAAILEAKVLVINKDYDFAVINIGAHEGVIVG